MYKKLRSPLTALSILIVILFVGLGFLNAGTGVNPVPDSFLAKTVEEAINKQRQKDNLSPYQIHETGRQIAETGVKALVEKIRINPRDQSLPAELKIDELKKALPEAAALTLEVCSGPTKDRLINSALRMRVSGKKGLTHLGLAVCQVNPGSGQSFWLLVALGLFVPSAINADSLNDGQNIFHLTCHQCGHNFTGRIKPLKTFDPGSIIIRCPSCQRYFDIFASDEKGNFHRPTWFIQGFEPATLSRPLKAWLYVLRHCEYTGDPKLFGRKDVWQLAKDTYHRRKGDCEDLSILLADWLITAGYEARVAMGKCKNEGHAWVILHHEDHNYILEATGTSRNYRRIPPRAERLPMYFPQIQFNDRNVWFRTDLKWTSEYFNNDEWAIGSWNS